MHYVILTLYQLTDMMLTLQESCGNKTDRPADLKNKYKQDLKEKGRTKNDREKPYQLA